MMKQISMIKKFTQVEEQISLDDYMQRIILCIYSYLIKPLRRMLEGGDQAGYDRLKKALPAGTISAPYSGGRGEKYRIGYNSWLVLDFDKLSKETLQRIKAVICGCPYTLACFVSPSGHGLKVFVAVSTGAEDHLQTFLSVAKYYSGLTGVQVDPSGKDISRLCFVSMDAEGYYNKNAAVFNPFMEEGHGWPEVKPVGPVVLKEGNVVATEEVVENGEPGGGRPQGSPLQMKGDGGVQDGDFEKLFNLPVKTNKTAKDWVDESTYDLVAYMQCVIEVEHRFRFEEGQRNSFVFSLALCLSVCKFSSDLTLRLMLQDYNYDEKEVREAVRSAYSYLQKPIKMADVKKLQKPTKKGKKTSDKAKSKKDKTADDNPGDTMVGPLSEAPPIGEPPVDEPPTEPPPADPPPPERKNRKGEKYDIEVCGKMIKRWYETRYNEVTGIVEILDRQSGNEFKRLNDYIENSLFYRLHCAGQLIPIGTLHCLLQSDFSVSFNPFWDYFKKLPRWDGTTDYIDRLCDTVKTADDEYWRTCFRKWFTAYVASLIWDDVINHTVIVFSGTQGVGKTTWMKKLAPREFSNYIGTAMMHSDNKDSSIMMTECALIIIDELESLNRRDLASFKEIITRPDFRIRRPYGRNAENLPHRASLGGSVNFEQILTDQSGTRRYLCFKVLEIDYQHKTDINLCMAQALALALSGFKYWFDQEEIRELNTRNEEFMSKSPEEDLIDTWMQPVTLEQWQTRNQFVMGNNMLCLSPTEIAIRLTEKFRIPIMDNTVIKIGRILKKKGFERIRKGNNFGYLVLFNDPEAVERAHRTTDLNPVPALEMAANDQIDSREEFNDQNVYHDELPF